MQRERVRHVSSRRQLQEAIQAGYKSDEWVNLLKTWGQWSRGGAGIGWHGGKSYPMINIDDDTALIIEQAAKAVKAKCKNAYQVFEWYVVEGHDAYWISKKLHWISREITRESKRKKYDRKHGRKKGVTHGRNFYAVNLNQMTAKDCDSPEGVLAVLQIISRDIFDTVRAQNPELLEASVKGVREA